MGTKKKGAPWKNPHEADVRTMSLDALFARVRHMHHHRAVDILENMGLLFGQPPVLFALWERDGQTQTDLANRMNRTPATVTVTLTRMERDGWVERRPDEHDLRVSRVFLTRKGLEVRPKVEEQLNLLDVRTFNGFDDTERALLRRFLMQMETNLRDDG